MLSFVMIITHIGEGVKLATIFVDIKIGGIMGDAIQKTGAINVQLYARHMAAFKARPVCVTGEMFRREVMRQKQETPPVLPAASRITPLRDFAEFLDVMAQELLHQYRHDGIFPGYPQSCFKMANAVAYAMRYGADLGDNAFSSAPHIDAYLARSTCKRYENPSKKLAHEFVILNIEGVEYVVDFAADQFARQEDKFERISPVILSLDEARRLSEEQRYAFYYPVLEVHTEFDRWTEEPMEVYDDDSVWRDVSEREEFLAHFRQYFFNHRTRETRGG